MNNQRQLFIQDCYQNNKKIQNEWHLLQVVNNCILSLHTAKTYYKANIHLILVKLKSNESNI